MTSNSVDIHQLASEIEAEVRARRAAGEYPPGFERELDRLFDRFAPPEVSTDFESALERAEDLVVIDPIIPVASRNAALGTVKQSVAKLVGWYHVWLAQQITGLATATNTALRLLGERLVELEHLTDDAARARGVGAGMPVVRDDGAWSEIVVASLRDRKGRVAVVECGDGALVAALVAAGVDAYGVEPRADMADAALARGLEIRRDDGSAHIHSVGPETLDALVLRGIVERSPLGSLLLLVDAAAAKLAVGGQLVVCSLTRDAWGRGATAAEADLVTGHPMHRDTWRAVLPDQGFRDVDVRGAGPNAFVIIATRTDS